MGLLFIAMALTFDIKTLVYKKLPFLLQSTDTDDLIELHKIESIALVCPPMEEQADEANYTNLQKSFLAELTAYELLKSEVLKNSGGVAGASPTGNKAIKKAKADVVEAEFEYLKPGTNLTEETSVIMGTLKKSICEKAFKLEVPLAMCDYGDFSGGIFMFCSK